MLLAAAVLAVFGVLFLQGPWWVDGDRLRRLTDPAEQHEVLSRDRDALLKILAGAGAAAALVFTGRNYLLAREGHVTDRYTKAVEQLGSHNLDVRLGGIYALERIARDSPTDHPTVVEVLAAFIREHTAVTNRSAPSDVNLVDRVRLRSSKRDQFHQHRPAPITELARPTVDVQAALTVLGRRDRTRDRGRVDLSGARLAGVGLRWADLRDADLRDADLRGADLFRAQLQDAWLSGAQLQQANLVEARLQNARMNGAQLQHANLTEALMKSAHLRGAKLQHALLFEAQLQDADLSSANLQSARLSWAQLQRADLALAVLDHAILHKADLRDAILVQAGLRGAILRGAELMGADLSGVDLTVAERLTAEQIDSAVILDVVRVFPRRLPGAEGAGQYPAWDEPAT